MALLTVGIDLSANERDTAACLLSWESGDVRIVELVPEVAGGPVSDEQLLKLIRRSNKTGIDCPFGWPEPFVQAVSEWERKREWTWGDRWELRYRLTDEQARGKPRMPLSVSADRLGATAMRCALLLSQVAKVNRAGTSGKVAEVYPAAALHAWKVLAPGYKDRSSKALQARKAIVRDLKRALGTAWQPSRTDYRRLEGEHDLLDAFVAALVARAVHLHKTSSPEDEDEKRRADFEGWIHVPRCSLREVLAA